MKRYIALLIAATVVLLVGCSDAAPQKVGENATSPTNSPDKVIETKEPQTTANSEEKTVKIFNIGDAVQIDDIIYTVNSIREVPENKFLSPEKGNVWYAVDITVENKGRETFNSSSLLMFTLIDGESYSYDIAIVPDLKGSVDGEIASEGKLRGEIAFEIPEDAKDLELEIDPILFGDGKVIVKLGL